MRRHEALIPLTHDHHHALVQVRRLRSAANGSEDDRRAAGAEFLEFFHGDTARHFDEEEKIVLPLVAGVPELRDSIERVMIEHVRIRSLVDELDGAARERVPRSEILLEIAGMLERHIRFEEKDLFPRIQELADEEALASITLPPRNRAGAGEALERPQQSPPDRSSDASES